MSERYGKCAYCDEFGEVEIKLANGETEKADCMVCNSGASGSVFDYLAKEYAKDEVWNFGKTYRKDDF